MKLQRTDVSYDALLLSCTIQVDAKGGAELSPGAACPLMARMVSGDTLGFSIQAYDCCLQRSGSCETLECSLQVTCEQLNPSRASFPINAAGVAVVEGECYLYLFLS